MSVCLTTWTVLPHGPIERVDDRVWRVDGFMASGLQRVQTIVKLDDGRLILHNAIALGEEAMAEIDAWGEVAAILVPNGYHRNDCRIMQERYPKARVYAPAGAAKAVAKATEVHGTYDDVPRDAHVRIAHLPGIGEREGVIEVQGSSGLTVVFNDMLANVPKSPFFVDAVFGPTGQVAIPRMMRWWWMKDARAVKSTYERIASEKPSRAIPGHGADLVGDVAAQLAPAMALL